MTAALAHEAAASREERRRAPRLYLQIATEFQLSENATARVAAALRALDEKTYKSIGSYAYRWPDWLRVGRGAPARVVAVIAALRAVVKGIPLPRCDRCERVLLVDEPTFFAGKKEYWCHQCIRSGVIVKATCHRCGRTRKLCRLTRFGAVCQRCTKLDRELWIPCPKCRIPGPIYFADVDCGFCGPRTLVRAVKTGHCWTCQRRLTRSAFTHCLKCRTASFLQSTFLAAPKLHPLRDLLLQKDQRAMNRKALEGPYGDALYELGRRGEVDPVWLAGLQPLVRSRLCHELETVGLLTPPTSDAERCFAWCTELLENEEASLAPADVVILKSFTRWFIFRRDSAREKRERRAHPGRTKSRRHDMRVAIAFCKNLHRHGLTLGTCALADYLRFRSDRTLDMFLRWVRKQGHLQFAIPTSVPPREVIGEPPGRRRAMVSKLLEDEAIPLHVRVAGLLCYVGFHQTEFLAIKVESVTTGEIVQIQIGKQHYHVREDISRLIVRLIDERLKLIPLQHRHLGSPWLFPGRVPGKPLRYDSLTKPFQRVGLSARTARNSFFLRAGQNMVWLVATARALQLSKHTIGNWRTDSGEDLAQFIGARYANELEGISPHASPADIIGLE